jgi:hypothetical protein
VSKIKPSIRPTETYTEQNFLRVYTAGVRDRPGLRAATIEHLSYQAGGGRPGWRCETIADGEVMSKDDALYIARSYAQRNGVPVIYESHGE